MSYKIHHLNCATLCPMGAKLINGIGSYFEPAKMVCHCLLIETNGGLVLIDTGLGTNDIARPKQMGWVFNTLVKPKLDVEETAIYQIQKLGFKKEDIKHIVLTHLHVDHAGGISDFPNAKVHVIKKEYNQVVGNKKLKLGYVAEQFQHYPDWCVHSMTGEKWNGFNCVKTFEPEIQDILLVPLHGHTAGHTGVFIPSEEGNVFHCGDAYFDHNVISKSYKEEPLGLKIFQGMVDYNTSARIRNQIRLTELFKKQKMNMRFICSHDHNEFEYCRCGKNPNDIN